MTRNQIFEFFRRLAENDPDPQTELEYGNAYQLVVAVALRAQATRRAPIRYLGLKKRY